MTSQVYIPIYSLAKLHRDLMWICALSLYLRIKIYNLSTSQKDEDYI